MIRPAARLAGRVHVGAAEEIGLHVHLLDFELAFLDALVHPLMARIEAAHMPGHRDNAGLLLDFHQRFGVRHAVGDRDFDQHMLAGAHHLLALSAVHLGRRGKDNGVGAPDAFTEVATPVRDAVFPGDLGGRILIAADQRHYLGVRDAFQRIQMLLTERALPGYADFHRLLLIVACLASCAAARFPLAALPRTDVARLPLVLLSRFSRMIWPTAVLDAGTV